MFYPVSFFTFFCIFSVVLLGASGVGGCVWQVVFSFFFLSLVDQAAATSLIYFFSEKIKKNVFAKFTRRKKNL